MDAWFRDTVRDRLDEEYFLGRWAPWIKQLVCLEVETKEPIAADSTKLDGKDGDVIRGDNDDGEAEQCVQQGLDQREPSVFQILSTVEDDNGDDEGRDDAPISSTTRRPRGYKLGKMKGMRFVKVSDHHIKRKKPEKAPTVSFDSKPQRVVRMHPNTTTSPFKFGVVRKAPPSSALAQHTSTKSALAWKQPPTKVTVPKKSFKTHAPPRSSPETSQQLAIKPSLAKTTPSSETVIDRNAQGKKSNAGRKGFGVSLGKLAGFVATKAKQRKQRKETHPMPKSTPSLPPKAPQGESSASSVLFSSSSPPPATPLENNHRVASLNAQFAVEIPYEDDRFVYSSSSQSEDQSKLIEADEMSDYQAFERVITEGTRRVSRQSQSESSISDSVASSVLLNPTHDAPRAAAALETITAFTGRPVTISEHYDVISNPSAHDPGTLDKSDIKKPSIEQRSEITTLPARPDISTSIEASEFTLMEAHNVRPSELAMKPEIVASQPFQSHKQNINKDELDSAQTTAVVQKMQQPPTAHPSISKPVQESTVQAAPRTSNEKKAPLKDTKPLQSILKRPGSSFKSTSQTTATRRMSNVKQFLRQVDSVESAGVVLRAPSVLRTSSVIASEVPRASFHSRVSSKSSTASDPPNPPVHIQSGLTQLSAAHLSDQNTHQSSSPKRLQSGLTQVSTAPLSDQRPPKPSRSSRSVQRRGHESAMNPKHTWSELTQVSTAPLSDQRPSRFDRSMRSSFSNSSYGRIQVVRSNVSSGESSSGPIDTDTYADTASYDGTLSLRRFKINYHGRRDLPQTSPSWASDEDQSRAPAERTRSGISTLEDARTRSNFDNLETARTRSGLDTASTGLATQTLSIRRADIAELQEAAVVLLRYFDGKSAENFALLPKGGKEVETAAAAFCRQGSRLGVDPIDLFLALSPSSEDEASVADDASEDTEHEMSLEKDDSMDDLQGNVDEKQEDGRCKEESDDNKVYDA